MQSAMSGKASFSILYRIEWVETADAGYLSHHRPPLSVSCIGSNGLKRPVRPSSWRSYPYLSVSCIGSNGLKHPANSFAIASPASFSILYRIEWVETHDNQRQLCRIASFSILYRIEWVETTRSAWRPRRGPTLSVSCIGSNGLKHVRRKRNLSLV